jgi:hypothetical protein
VFTGETYLQTDPPIDPSSLTRWRKRLGEAGIEELLAETIEAAKRAGVIKASSMKRVIVDTTVMQKAIAHPTDSRLLERPYRVAGTDRSHEAISVAKAEEQQALRTARAGSCFMPSFLSPCSMPALPSFRQHHAERPAKGIVKGRPVHFAVASLGVAPIDYHKATSNLKCNTLPCVRCADAKKNVVPTTPA